MISILRIPWLVCNLLVLITVPPLRLRDATCRSSRSGHSRLLLNPIPRFCVTLLLHRARLWALLRCGFAGGSLCSILNAAPLWITGGLLCSSLSAALLWFAGAFGLSLLCAWTFCASDNPVGFLLCAMVGWLFLWTISVTWVVSRLW